MMGKLREGKYTSFAIMVVVSHLWTWHLSAFHSVNWVFSLSLSRSTFMSHATPLIHVHCYIVFRLVNSILESIWSCRPMFKGKSCWYFTPAVKQHFVSVTFESVLWLHHTQNSITLFLVSCCRCGIHHGPPSTRLFLSTLSHHLGNSLRNKCSTLRSVCLNDRFYRHRFMSLTFDR